MASNRGPRRRLPGDETTEEWRRTEVNQGRGLLTEPARADDSVHWEESSVAYIIVEPCVGVKDKACVEICPVDCIYEGTKEGFPDMLFIHPEECIDCGVCQPECPVDAILPEDDVPEEWNDYIRINKEFFD